jgi:hypothetical protein
MSIFIPDGSVSPSVDAIIYQGPPGPKGDKGERGENGSDASVTISNIISALGYTPEQSGEAAAAQSAAIAAAAADATAKANAAQAAAIAASATTPTSLTPSSSTYALQAPSGTFAAGARAKYHITPSAGCALTMDPAIVIPSDSTFVSKLLTAHALYIVQLEYSGSFWVLESLVGGYTQPA